MADWWSQPRIEPIQVYGPTMKTSSSPMTRGGSSSAQRTPASQILGNGSRSRAIIHASGVQHADQHGQRHAARLDRREQRVQVPRTGQGRPQVARRYPGDERDHPGRAGDPR